LPFAFLVDDRCELSFAGEPEPLHPTAAHKPSTAKDRDGERFIPAELDCKQRAA
jgi:hypothetical protein